MTLIDRFRRASSTGHDRLTSVLRLVWVALAVFWACAAWFYDVPTKWLALCVVPMALLDAYFRFYVDQRTPFVILTEAAVSVVGMLAFWLSIMFNT